MARTQRVARQQHDADTESVDGPNGKAKKDASSKTNGVDEIDVMYAPAGSLPTTGNLYEGKPDRHGRSGWTKEYPDDLEEPPENAESAQYALILRNKKSFDAKKKLELHSIIVQSNLIKGVLGYVLKDYPGINTKLERVEFQAPFQPFVHRWEAFAKAREDETDPETRVHVELLWKVLEEELRSQLDEKHDHISHGVVRFDNIWTIFEPGSLVSHDDDGHDRVYKLVSASYANSRCGGRVYSLACQYIDFDGERFGYCSANVQIPAFLGTESITNLDAYPLDHHDDQTGVTQKLVARGRVFEQLKGYHFKSYKGVAAGNGVWGPVKHSINSRIIIDTDAYNLFNPNSKVNVSFLKPDENVERADGLNGARNAKMSDSQLLLTTPKVRGYALKSKQWLQFDVDSVQEIVWNGSAFASLVAPPDQKELILAFAESQARSKDRFEDFIASKGKGIIMLLSGPPGVGKTLTAESVAETLKVPLYCLSSGDLGTEVTGVEAALSKVLQMNEKWGAVLLLDEADVFLEARSPHDLERNKLVSIFLRMLEYYEGILFLTTNRVENIDAAFESRIHLALEYEELDKAARKQIWKTFLKQSSTVGEFSEEEIDTLASEPINGRVIKNLLKTAQLLAGKQEVPLRLQHIETVMKLRARRSKKRAFSAVTP